MEAGNYRREVRVVRKSFPLIPPSLKLRNLRTSGDICGSNRPYGRDLFRAALFLTKLHEIRLAVLVQRDEFTIEDATRR
jgi:hypothetical protein